MQPKGIDTTEIDYFGKLIMCSNNENNFIPLEESDIRFFIIKVKKFEQEDPDFLDKLISEIPAFLYFLKDRKIFHPKESRAWFHKKYLVTDQMHKVVKYTRPRLEQDIYDYLEDMFLTFELDTLKIDATKLTEEVNKQAKYKHNKSDIVRYLKEERSMIASNIQRYKLPTRNPSFTVDDNELSFIEEDCLGRVYIFNKEDWVANE